MKASVELLPTAEAALHRWERSLYAVDLHMLREILKRQPFSASAARAMRKEQTAVAAVSWHIAYGGVYSISCMVVVRMTIYPSHPYNAGTEDGVEVSPRPGMGWSSEPVGAEELATQYRLIQTGNFLSILKPASPVAW